MPKNDDLLVLVDGSSYLFRAFHALPPLTNSKGQATGAVYGVVNMLRKLMDDYDPKHVAVVFDAPGRTFRDDLFEEYKSNRPPMPDDLRTQIEPLHRLVAALGLPLLVIPGVEADDVIGTLAVRAEAQGLKVLISTGDKDMAQLVNDNITLLDTMKNRVSDAAAVKEKFGVGPELIIDFLALVGDTSDNIPGVPGVGPKTASKWLNEYGSLDEVVANADKVGGKIGEKLRNSLDILPLSKKLATIQLDVELELKPSEMSSGAPDKVALKKLYQEMEFKTWLRRLDEGAVDEEGEREGSVTPQSDGVERDYQVILDEAEFEAWVQKLEKAELFAFDTETTSLDYVSAEVVGVSFATDPFVAAYVPFGHDYLGAPKQIPQSRVLARLKPLLENAKPTKIGQNLKYDKSVLANHGITLNGIAHDTMLESYVLDSTGSRHDMDTLASKYLGETTVKFTDIAGKGAKQLTFNQIALEEAGPYAAEDADITLRLHQNLWPRLEKNVDQAKLYRELEVPLLSVLSKIERTGVLVDAKALRAQSAEIAKRLTELENEAYDLAGGPFNLASPKQLQEILFEKLEIPVGKKTKTGQPSTNEEVLQELALSYPLPRVILEYRGLAKLKSTYTDKLPLQVNPKTGRVHTSYHQAVASTGRLSSSDPNLQNIPVRTAEGRRIRQAFIAPEGYCLLAADYSQIELRIMAHLSGDEGLMSAFASGADVHRATAAEVFGVSLDEVSSDQRRSAKAINFGLIYGMSAFGLARQLNIARSDAQEYVNRYFERYPGVKAFMDKTRTEAAEQGYVVTVFGRRLYLPEIRSSNAQRRQAAERTAINAPMQGTAADIIKRATLAVDSALESSGLDARVIMQVHDELVLEVKREQETQVREMLTECMANAAELRVPLVVDIGVGENWDEAH